MDNTPNTAKRKSSGLIAKNLIILVVLVAVCVFSMWAWFTQKSSAIAHGIEVRAKANGVEVSWDNKDFYYDLTEIEEVQSTTAAATGNTDTSSTVASSTAHDIIGPALSLYDNNGNPATLKLVTGNGIEFFEPYINRRLGTVLLESGTDTTKNWSGIDITKDNADGRYIDIPLYFRGTEARKIYLAGDSTVSPKTENERMSMYGDFSTDYIAAASRVAFLNSAKDVCSFIWAPNADVRLTENSSGYIKYTETATDTITTSGGGNVVDGEVEEQPNKTYYFWTLNDDAPLGDAPDTDEELLTDFEYDVFSYDAERRYYVTTVDTYIPTYSNNPSIPIFINESTTLSAGDNYNNYIDGALSKTKIMTTNGQYFGVTNTGFNIGNTTCSNAMYITDTSKISTGTKIQYELGYDPVNKILVILSYDTNFDDDELDYSLGGIEKEITTTVTYHPLDGGITCALVNADTSNAVSSGDNSINSVNFTTSEKNAVSSTSITLAEQFTTVINGSGYSATYKFRNNNTNTYLTLSDDGKVSFTNSGSEFTLCFIDGLSVKDSTGPFIKCGDNYLAVKNGRVCGVTESELTAVNSITVYTGTSYTLETKLENDSQVYKYYDSKSKSEKSLNSTTSPQLYTSSCYTDANSVIGPVIAELTKTNESDEYFTAQIVIRVWVEGTDREAKTPLADGIFDLNLHFVSY